MGKIFKFLGLIAVFAFMVSCCAKKVPPISMERDIPIDPASVLFIGGGNILTEQAVSGTAIVVESNDKWSWAVSAGHVCYPEIEDNYVMLTDAWLMFGFNFQGEYEPIFMVALDQVNDICVFRIPLGNLPNAPLAKQMPAIGEKVWLGAFLQVKYFLTTM